ncbi:MAG TPA: hypothetical protein VFX30_10850 [bacterium]|nr:hypothetical protein [bacterium]
MPQDQDAPRTASGGRHAIVIGASMAGLLSARVLSDHFERVTVIDRDELPDGPDARKGVPQGRHVHSILAKGDQIMERLFPGLFQTLRREGAEFVDLANDMSWRYFGRDKMKFDSGVGMYTLSRPFLDWHIRKRLADIPNINVTDRCEVLRFLTTPDQSRVTGVAIRRDGNEDWTADLIVDAGGRGSRTPLWLEELGYQKPRESVIKVNVGYATRVYRRPAEPTGWKVLLVYPTPPGEKRLGCIFPVEGNRWMVTLVGWVGDHPPSSDEGYLEFARNLSTTALYDAIKNAEPLTSIATHKFPFDLRHHYEDLTRFPAGLIVLGDALCSFNPIYGQGMTTSALAVSLLENCLDRHRKGVWNLDDMVQRFRKMSHKAVETAWMIAASEDFRYAAAEETSLKAKLLNRYFRKIHELGSCDPHVHRRFLQVMTMIKPASAIFQPQFVWHVLRSKVPPPGADRAVC